MKLQALLVTLLLAGTLCANAQDLEPRAYANAPIGLNFLIGGYVYSEGGVAVDPSIPLENASFEIQSAVTAFARSFGLWGRSAKFDATLPYVFLSGEADFDGAHYVREVDGFGDPRMRVSINLYGAPALPLREISAYRQDFIFGASLSVQAPFGQYDSSRLVNIGTNRWAFKPELGVSKAWGRWLIEAAAAVALYDDNDDFFGGRHREQDPVYSAQGGFIYTFPSNAWLALSGTYYTGGRTTLDGRRGRDLQKNSRIGLTVAIPVNRNHSIKLYASSGVSTRTGSNFDTFGAAWQYRWGGGL